MAYRVRSTWVARGRRGARAARAHSGRDVTPTQRARLGRHSPPLAAAPCPNRPRLAISAIIVATIIYLHSEAKQIKFGW